MKIVYHHRTRSTDAQRIHIREIVTALRGLGHEVEIVSLVPTGAGRDTPARDAGEAPWKRAARRVPFLYDIIQLGYNVAGVPLLLAGVLRGRADFLYERYALFNFAGVLVSRIRRIPLVLEVNSPFALEQSRDKDIRMSRFAAWSERAICNRAARVIVVSTPLARMMERAGVAREKIEIMPNGVRPEDFEPAPADPELRASLGLSNQTVIGFAGWFRKWHGIELLLEAFQRAGLAGKSAKVLLIGDGAAMAELRQYVEKRDLKSDVLFTGPLPHEKVPRYLNLIDIAVQPAANEYCCPMKILEYMALGKAIVAPRQENIQELLREGSEARYFVPGDAAGLAAALSELVEDREKALSLGRRARSAIFERGYLWSVNARRVVEMMEGRKGKRQKAKIEPYRVDRRRTLI